MLVALPGDLAQVSATWTLVENHEGQQIAVPHQMLPHRPAILTWILSGETAAKALRTYEFRPSTQRETKPKAVFPSSVMLRLWKCDPERNRYFVIESHAGIPPQESIKNMVAVVTFIRCGLLEEKS